MEDKPPAPTEIIRTDSLTLVGDGYRLVIPPAAHERKRKLIEAAEAITQVTSPEEAAAARDEIKRLAGLRNEVEKARKIVKEPVIEKGREIDTDSKEFVSDAVAQEERLKGLVADHAAEVEKKRREAEAEARRVAAEEARKAREAEAERLRKEREIQAAREEADRKEREAAEAAANAESEEEMIEAELAAEEAERKKRAAQAEADRQAEEDRRAQAKADVDAAEAARRAKVMARQKTSGVSFVTDIEVVDVSALYAFDPSLVELRPRIAEIKAAVARMEAANGGVLPTIPGLTLTRKPKVSTR